MFHIGLDEQTSTAIIGTVAMNLPIGSLLGDILVVTTDGVIARDDAGSVATYGISASDGSAWRTVDIDNGLSEVTAWRNGTEIYRCVRRTKT